MDSIHPALATAAFVVSIATLIAGALAAPVLLARLPEDYFVQRGSVPPAGPRSLLQNALLALRSTLGALLILVGVAMLVLPGQGVLTIVAGLSLLRFPGKRRLQRRLLRLPGIHALVAAIRRGAGKPPLQL